MKKKKITEPLRRISFFFFWSKLLKESHCNDNKNLFQKEYHFVTTWNQAYIDRYALARSSKVDLQ